MEDPECVFFRKLRTLCGSDLGLYVDLPSEVCNHLGFNAGDSIFKMIVNVPIQEKVQSEIVRPRHEGTYRHK